MRVLIVDDSKIVQEGLKRVIDGMEDIEICGTAGDAEGALRFIVDEKPDTVILDIRLPGQSGIDVLRSIRERELPIKVIMLTNYPYPQYRKKCEELGVDYFFDKVTEIEKVRETLERMKNGS